MEKSNRMKETDILAGGILLGLAILGFCLKGGIDNLVNKDRRVTVKGLSVKTAESDEVAWTIQTKSTGNDLAELHSQINKNVDTVKEFLVSKGIAENEISVSAPSVTDHTADTYSTNKPPYHYSVLSKVKVASTNVKLVRKVIDEQGELLSKGIAVEDNTINYYLNSFPDMKPTMMAEAIKNAEKTAQLFAENSHSTLNKIETADQGLFSIDDGDEYTNFVKSVRVVTTVTYSLKD